MNVVIREARTDEAPALTEVAFAAKRHWEYPEAWIALWADELTVDAHDVAARRTFVAANGGRILGWCAVAEERGDHWIDACWVLPDAAGNGIGRRLVDRILALAAESGWPALRVIADPNAEGFYRKLGFRRIGEHPSVPEGRMLPVLAMNLGGAGDSVADGGVSA